jgi:hypothetical protein
MDFLKWGEIILDNKKFKIIAKPNSDLLYYVKIKGFTNHVTLKNKFFKKEKILKLITFTDIRNDGNNLGSFIRKIGDQEYIFMDGNFILKTLDRKTRFLTSIKLNNKLFNNFLTLDIETRDIRNKKTPYCICWYDGVSIREYFLSDFKNPKEMILTAIKALLIKKYHNHCVYVHNLSKFDGTFFLHYYIK